MCGHISGNRHHHHGSGLLWRSTTVCRRDFLTGVRIPWPPPTLQWRKSGTIDQLCGATGVAVHLCSRALIRLQSHAWVSSDHRTSVPASLVRSAISPYILLPLSLSKRAGNRTSSWSSWKFDFGTARDFAENWIGL